jgi:beta-lactamase regulating signal transducer with metallopeptidase domain
MWVIFHTAGTVLLAVVVLILCRWRRLGPAARHALWLLVLLKLLTPPFISWPWALPLSSLVPPATVREVNHERETADILAPAVSNRETGSQPPAPPDNASRDLLLSLPAVEQSTSVPADPSPGSEHSSLLRDRWAEAAAAVWLCGGIAVAFVQLRRLAKMRHGLTHARPAPPWLTAQVEAVAHTLGVRPPRLALLPGLASPFVWAGGRVCLLWPEDLGKHLSPEGCRAVLVHELAHLSRRDHWVGWLLVIAGCVWWWHPLYYLVRRQLHRQAELACDALVIAAMPDARRCYAEALLDVCQRQSWTAAATPTLGVAGRRRDLERRLVMIMRANVPGRLTARGLVGIALLGMIMLPAWTLGQGDGKPTPAERDKQLQSLEHKLKEVLKELEGQRKAPSSPAKAGYIETTKPSEVEYLLTFVDSGTAKPAEQDKKIQELEAKVKALLKEVQALRASKTSGTQTGTPLWEVTTGTQYFTIVSDGVVVQAAPTEVALTRTTYKLPAAKAEALGKFLQQHVKATVMETRVEGESLIVTTTPEVQRGIGQFINLIEGKSPQTQGKTMWEFNRPQPK